MCVCVCVCVMKKVSHVTIPNSYCNVYRLYHRNNYTRKIYKIKKKFFINLIKII